jgi:hypothetical protein
MILSAEGDMVQFRDIAEKEGCEERMRVLMEVEASKQLFLLLFQGRFRFAGIDLRQMLV